MKVYKVYKVIVVKNLYTNIESTKIHKSKNTLVVVVYRF